MRPGGRPARFAFALAFTLALASVVGGCASWTETPFVREASDAASTLSAAAELLEASHTERLTGSYVQGAFLDLEESISGLDSELPQLEGRPDDATVKSLADELRTTVSILRMPCLDSSCDWQGQLMKLRDTSDAFTAQLPAP
ncbi:MAG: hypothetical protein WKF56_09360 [Candidatus Limnocylindrales bacterium]